MIFSTYQFIFLFLPVTFFVYFLLNRFRYYSIAKIWLVLASLYFYGQGSPDFFPFFLGSVVGNYVVGSCLANLDGEQKAQRKLLLFIGVIANVALLGYYKYTDFFIDNFNKTGKVNVDNVKEILGHSPIQVLAGFILGLLIGFMPIL